MNKALGPLDERGRAFMVASLDLTNAIMRGEEISNRYLLLSNAAGVVGWLMRSIEYPRDEVLLSELADLSFKVTDFLDRIALNAPEKDARLQILREAASMAPLPKDAKRPPPGPLLTTDWRRSLSSGFGRTPKIV